MQTLHKEESYKTKSSAAQ